MSKIVLCVDDDPDDQMLVLETIQEIAPSLRVATAINGLEALEFLKEAKRKPNTWEFSLIIRGVKDPTGIIPCPWK